MCLRMKKNMCHSTSGTRWTLNDAVGSALFRTNDLKPAHSCDDLCHGFASQGHNDGLFVALTFPIVSCCSLACFHRMHEINMSKVKLLRVRRKGGALKGQDM